MEMKNSKIRIIVPCVLAVVFMVAGAWMMLRSYTQMRYYDESIAQARQALPSLLPPELRQEPLPALLRPRRALQQEQAQARPKPRRLRQLLPALRPSLLQQAVPYFFPQRHCRR